MSQERIPNRSFFDNSESEPSQQEKQIKKLFKRAGWHNVDTPEARRQTIRDGFEQLLQQTLSEKNSPYKINESESKDKSYFTVAITKDQKTIAAKSSLNQQLDGQPQTVYTLVRQTGRLRRNLVFQLIEYPAFGNVKKPSELHIGYYWGEGKAHHIISDK